MLSESTSDEVLFEFDGTNEWYDFYSSGVQDGDYPRCNGTTDLTDCTAASLSITYDGNFIDFATNQTSLNSALSSSTDLFIDYSAPLDMSQFIQ